MAALSCDRIGDEMHLRIAHLARYAQTQFRNARSSRKVRELFRLDADEVEEQNCASRDEHSISAVGK